MLVFCVLRTTIWHCTGKGLHMGMLIALLPALFLGSNSVMTAKIDGKPSQGTLGTTFGAFLFAVLMAVCYTIPHAGASFAFNPRIWVVGLCSGIFWTIGSIGQFSALKPLGVSLAMPISTARQVVGNALMAAIVLGDRKSVV